MSFMRRDTVTIRVLSAGRPRPVRSAATSISIPAHSMFIPLGRNSIFSAGMPLAASARSPMVPSLSTIYLSRGCLSALVLVEVEPPAPRSGKALTCEVHHAEQLDRRRVFPSACLILLSGSIA